MRTSRLRPVLVVTTALAALVACSSDGDMGSGPSPSGTAKVQASGKATPKGDPIRLEFIGPLSGPSQASQIPAAAKAAAQAINDAGGVKGRPIEIVTCDTKNSTAGETSCAQKLAGSNTTALISEQAGNTTSVVDASVKNNIANIGLSGVGQNDLLAASTTSFPLAVPASGVLVCPAALSAAGAKRIGTLALDVGAALVAGTKAVIAHVPGASYTTNAQVSLTDNNVASQVQTLINSKSDGVVLALVEPQVISALNSNNGRLKMCTTDGVVSTKDLEGLGNAAANFVQVSAVPPINLVAESGAAGKQFSTEISAYYAASNDPGASPDNVNGQSISGWMSVRAFADVAATLPTVTRTSVVEGFAKTSDLSFPGLLAQPVDFTKPTPIPNLARLFNANYHAYTWGSKTNSFTAMGDDLNLISLLTG